MLKNTLKFVGKTVAYILALILTYALLIPFLWGPIYDFPEPQPFTGEHFYNPYKNIDSSAWFKGNFHAHANPYGILTDGRKNTSEAIFQRYDSLNYRSFSITNYMHIDTHNSNAANYIAAYEHGYSPIKYHQLVLGATQVSYFDYPLFQWTSNKQFIINKVHQNNHLVAIAHPSFLGAYTDEDASKLCNYDLIEVMNQRKYSFDFWDAALSAGRAVWILANDDTHDLDDPADYGMQATLINAPNSNANEVLSAMKAGRTMGYAPVNSPEYGHDLKIWQKDLYPRLLSFEVKENGEISGRFDKPIKEYHVYAQNGEEVAYVYSEHQDNRAIHAQFEQQHQYLRFKVNFEDADLVFLNPVVRYDGIALPEFQVKINIWKTLFWRGISWMMLITVLIFGVGMLKKQAS
jgi:hypothetical protein